MSQAYNDTKANEIVQEENQGSTAPAQATPAPVEKANYLNQAVEWAKANWIVAIVVLLVVWWLYNNNKAGASASYAPMGAALIEIAPSQEGGYISGVAPTLNWSQSVSTPEFIKNLI